MNSSDKKIDILVIRLSAMGDVAMVVPVLKALVTQNPNVRVTMLTTPFNAQFFEGIPSVEVFKVDIKNKYSSLWGVFRLFLLLRRTYRFRMVVDLHNVIRTKFLRKLYRFTCTKVYIIDKGRKDKEALTALPEEKTLKPLKTTIERYADTFRRGGFSLEIPASAEKIVRTLPTSIEKMNLKREGVWVGIAPFAQHHGKIYPLHLLIDTLSKIEQQNRDVTIFLFGGGFKERNITESLERQFPFCHSVVGKLSIKEELDLISNLDSIVSMDSVAMHMASIVGTRVVSIWGATHPYAGFLGYGQSIDDAVSIDLDCRPCSIYGNKPCYKNNYECLFSISPEKIIERIFA